MRLLAFAIAFAIAGSVALAGMSMQGPDPVPAAVKCRTMGYSHGAIARACVRAMTADFCGDGTSHTVEGVLIDIYDAGGIQRRATEASDVEAEWSSAGATCVSERSAKRGLRAGEVKAPCLTYLPRCTSADRPASLVTTAIPR